MSKMQRTVVLVKPDAMQRGLVGEIVSRFERKGLKLVGVKMLVLTDEILDSWYEHHKDKGFFGVLKDYMKWTPIIAMVWQGLGVVEAVRKITGITQSREAEAGSIRGDLSMSTAHTLIHASDSLKAAEKEVNLIFKGKELFEWEGAADCLYYSKDGR